MQHRRNFKTMQTELSSKPTTQKCSTKITSNAKKDNAPISPVSLSPLSIAVVGLLKAGKSTLLNAMTGQEELFKSGVIRTTVKNQHVKDGYFEWIDTPGIDDTDQETATAFAGLKNADTVLFTHNLKQGELDRMEVDFLQTCSQQDGQFLTKLRFVFTHIDDLEPSTVDIIQQKISQQCHALFHTVPPMIAVSSTRYIKGHKEDKKLLMEKSMIPLLRQQLMYLSQNKKLIFAKLFAKQLKEQLKEQLERVNAELNLIVKPSNIKI